jgi:ribosomal protein S18 acetylase RimI-like enzyme
VGEPALAWAYYAPDQHADAVWNIWWIGVQPASQGLGAGRGLLHHIEARVAAQGARLVVIETSATAGLARARRFYASQGYAECGRVPDFYAEGDDKVVFARRPRPSP